MTSNKMTNLSVLSLNIRGLNNDLKRTQLFTLMKGDPRFINSHIICLVETRLHQKDHPAFSHSWNGPTFFSSNEGSQGVAILVKKTTDIQITSSWSSDDGRALQIKFEWKGLPISLSTVYAPAVTPDRAPFFESLSDNLPIDDDVCLNILCGDFNCIEDPTLDKSGGNPNSGTDGFTELQNITALLDLEDLWRIKHPQEQVFTWEGNMASGLVRTRIDRFYTSTLLRPFVKNIEHPSIPIPNLDHKGVLLTLEEPDLPRPGPGYWKFNPTLLKNEWFVSQLREKLQLFLPSIENCDDVVEWWEDIKKKIQSAIIKLAKINDAFLKRKNAALQKDLKTAETLLNLIPNLQILQEEYTEIKKEIEVREKEKTEKLCLLANAKFLLAQELPTKKLKMITQLSIKGSTIKELNHPEKGVSKKAEDLLDCATLFYSDLYKKPPKSRQVTSAQNLILGY